MESRKRTIENSKSCTKLEMKVATYAFKMLSLVCTHHRIWLGFFSKMFPFLKTRWMSFQYENLLQNRNTQQPLEDLFLTLCLKGASIDQH